MTLRKKLIEVADQLDTLGMYKEAAKIDHFLKYADILSEFERPLLMKMARMWVIINKSQGKITTPEAKDYEFLDGTPLRGMTIEDALVKYKKQGEVIVKRFTYNYDRKWIDTVFAKSYETFLELVKNLFSAISDDSDESVTMKEVNRMCSKTNNAFRQLHINAHKAENFDEQREKEMVDIRTHVDKTIRALKIAAEKKEKQKVVDLSRELEYYVDNKKETIDDLVLIAVLNPMGNVAPALTKDEVRNIRSGDEETTRLVSETKKIQKELQVFQDFEQKTEENLGKFEKEVAKFADFMTNILMPEQDKFHKRWEAVGEGTTYNNVKEILKSRPVRDIPQPRNARHVNIVIQTARNDLEAFRAWHAEYKRFLDSNTRYEIPFAMFLNWKQCKTSANAMKKYKQWVTNIQSSAENAKERFIESKEENRQNRAKQFETYEDYMYKLFDDLGLDGEELEGMDEEDRWSEINEVLSLVQDEAIWNKWIEKYLTSTLEVVRVYAFFDATSSITYGDLIEQFKEALRYEV